MRVRRTGPGLETVIDRISELHGASLQVGIIAASVASGESTGVELVRIAAAQEYGTDTIPPRPFLRVAIKRNRRRWLTAIESAIPAAALRGVSGVLQVYRTAGVVIVGDVQDTLYRGPWIPLADETIRRKGSSTPLVDTSQLVQSIRALLVVGSRSEVVG